jgi:hypothetical protein
MDTELSGLKKEDTEDVSVRSPIVTTGSARLAYASLLPARFTGHGVET